MDSLNRETPAGVLIPPVLKKTKSRFICDAERHRGFLGKLYKEKRDVAHQIFLNFKINLYIFMKTKIIEQHLIGNNHEHANDTVGRQQIFRKVVEIL